MQEEILWAATDKQPGAGAWVTGSYNRCQVQCMLGQQAVAVCLSWDGGMEQVKRRSGRSEIEKKGDRRRWLGVGVLQLKLFQKRCGSSGCVTGFCVCASCVFSSQKRGQVCSMGLACAFSLCVCVCVFALRLRLRTCRPTHTCLKGRVVTLCRSRCWKRFVPVLPAAGGLRIWLPQGSKSSSTWRGKAAAPHFPSTPPLPTLATGHCSTADRIYTIHRLPGFLNVCSEQPAALTVKTHHWENPLLTLPYVCGWLIFKEMLLQQETV